jgi:hypothetical protein
LGGLQTSDTGFAIALLRDNRQMLYLKCTGIVQKILKLPKSMLAEALPNPAPLGNWYVNRFDIGRRKAYVFMSETTLLSFILFQGKKPVTVETLPTMLLAGLAQLLNMRGFSEDAIERAMVHYQDGFFARTNSRHDLGSLNDLVQRYQWIIESDGGLDHCDLTSIIMGTNNMPQRRLGWCTSWEVTQSKLQLLS